MSPDPIQGVVDWAARHDACHKTGAELMNSAPIDLVWLAKTAAEFGGDIRDRQSDWGKAYDAALKANHALRGAQYWLGRAVSKDKPPMAGPAWLIS